MILKELFNTLTEKLDGRRLAPGEPGRPVKGWAVDEEAEGWLGPDEVVVTDRKKLDARFLASIAQGGAPAVVWRTENEPSSEVVSHAEEIGLGLLVISPSVSLRKLFSLLPLEAEGEGLLRYSHEAAQALMQSAADESSMRRLVEKLAGLLGRPVAVEDTVGRLLASGGTDSGALISTLETHGLRASRGTGVEETRRARPRGRAR